MKKVLLTGALITILMVSLFILTGCGEKQSETTPTSNTNNAQIEATEFYIQNSFQNDTTITEIYATVTNLETWTPNLIAGLELAPQTRAKIGLGLTAQTSTWDIKVVDSEGTSVIYPAIDLTTILEKKAETLELTVNDEGQLETNIK